MRYILLLFVLFTINANAQLYTLHCNKEQMCSTTKTSDCQTFHNNFYMYFYIQDNGISIKYSSGPVYEVVEKGASTEYHKILYCKDEKGINCIFDLYLDNSGYCTVVKLSYSDLTIKYWVREQR